MLWGIGKAMGKSGKPVCEINEINENGKFNDR